MQKEFLNLILLWSKYMIYPKSGSSENKSSLKIKKQYKKNLTGILEEQAAQLHQKSMAIPVPTLQ